MSLPRQSIVQQVASSRGPALIVCSAASARVWQRQLSEVGVASAAWTHVSDHLGSVRLVLKASDGTVVQETAYDSWGVVTSDSASIEKVPFGFAGGLRDLDTGLTLMGARWYDPVVGRWVTKDPSLFAGGVNLYRYANNDPVNFFDATGHRPEGTGSWDFPDMPEWGSGGGLQGGGALALAGVGTCGIDGPAPIADTIGIPMMIVGAIWAAISSPKGPEICKLVKVTELTCNYWCPLSGPEFVSRKVDPKTGWEPANDNDCAQTIPKY